MEDEKIIDLYWQREEAAIGETQKKYDRYLGGISYRILSNREDSAECVSGKDTLKEKTDLMLLAEAITEYLQGLPEEARKSFLCRYFFADSIQEIAAYQRTSPSKIKSQLYRTRIGLRAHLEQAGWTL